MEPFLIKFKELSDNKYEYLKLKEAKMTPDNMTGIITFYVPYDIYNSEEFNLEVRARINNICASIFPKDLACKVVFEQIQLLPEVVKRLVVDFIIDEYSRILEGHYFSDEIEVLIDKKKVTITLPVDDLYASYCENKGFSEKLLEFLDSKLYAQFNLLIKPIKVERKIEDKKMNSNIVVDDGIVSMRKLNRVLGKEVFTYPYYISKYTEKTENATICGKVVGLDKKTSKAGKVFYTFKLTDPTGDMECIYFARSAKKSIFNTVKQDEEILVQGRLDLSNFTKKFVLFVDSVYKVQIDWEKTQKKLDFIKSLTLKTKLPEPKPFVDNQEREYTLLSEQIYIAPILRERDFVVFDLETTGLDLNKDRIVEIGACRISHGEIISTYTTLIDPKMPIPIGASNVNHITDAMVKEAPILENVLPSFLNYCKDADLVGHNAVRFDYPFIKNRANALNYTFDFKCYDTMMMFKEYMPNAKTYKLSECIKKFNIVNENAHRALQDTIVTAKLFINLCNEMKLTD